MEIKMKYRKLGKNDIWLFWKLIAASLLYVFPIILADRYYNDDLARALKGATGWKGDGRPLGEYLILLLCGGQPIVDLSPLLLILSVIILSFSLVLYANEYFKNFDDENMKMMVLLFIITNPFAMSNLSYKFDCIIMFVSLGISFLAYAVPASTPAVLLALCSGVAGVLIMSFYQPAIGMCIVLFLIAFFLNLMEGKGQLKYEINRLMSIVIGAITYKVVVAPRYVAVNDWRHEASKTISNLSVDSVKTIIMNFENYFAYIGNYARGISIVNKMVLAVLLVVSLSAVIVKYYSVSLHKRWHKGIGIVFIVALPMMALMGLFFPLAVLESLALRSRIFISFGGVLFLIGLFCMYFGKKHKVIASLLLLSALSFQYIYMYAYGNALKSQNEYEKYLVYNIAHDLETINVSEGIEKVSFDGNTPQCRQVQMMCEKYPFFQEIVPVYFNNDTWIGGAWVYHYLQPGIEIEALTDEDMVLVNSAEPIIENLRYSCYINEKKAIIQFR